MLIVVKNDNLRRSAETIQRYRHRERGREISPPLDVHDFTWHFGALSGQNYRPVVDSFPLSARRNPIDNTGFYIATAAATRNHSCIPRLFEPTRLVMSVEDGFDRERILEWLLGVANPADPNRQSEVYESASVYVCVHSAGDAIWAYTCTRGVAPDAVLVYILLPDSYI